MSRSFLTPRPGRYCPNRARQSIHLGVHVVVIRGRKRPLSRPEIWNVSVLPHAQLKLRKVSRKLPSLPLVLPQALDHAVSRKPWQQFLLPLRLSPPAIDVAHDRKDNRDRQQYESYPKTCLRSPAAVHNSNHASPLKIPDSHLKASCTGSARRLFKITSSESFAGDTPL